MTYWSRDDPVSLVKGPTDHWTKMKLGINTVQQSPRSKLPWDDPGMKMSWQFQGPATHSAWRPNNRLSPLDLDNCYQHRAKEGFRYWLIERPKPTLFGRYGLGSHKTVLGIGNAPRT
ncbi:uncharacterized protein LOC121368182 isoform X2 [Gigantopelta aegis]|nr:uncharacterized protein LOC121368182 isoform X2 [Gigantopelta aegis]XP_041348746.1 uncharacterized protein LOC121368182 isoform X2 [Gigantopelta aegis]